MLLHQVWDHVHNNALRRFQSVQIFRDAYSELDYGLIHLFPRSLLGYHKGSTMIIEMHHTKSVKWIC